MRNSLQLDMNNIIKLLFVTRFNCQNVHWNYSGENFIQIHGYMDENLKVLNKYLDLIIEDFKQNELNVNHPLVYIQEYINDITDEDINHSFNISDSDKMIAEYYNNVDELIDLIMLNSYDLNVTLDNILEEFMSELGKIRWFLRATFNDLITI